MISSRIAHQSVMVLAVADTWNNEMSEVDGLRCLMEAQFFIPFYVEGGPSADGGCIGDLRVELRRCREMVTEEHSEVKG